MLDMLSILLLRSGSHEGLGLFFLSRVPYYI